jgi:hypothetical protein
MADRLHYIALRLAQNSAGRLDSCAGRSAPIEIGGKRNAQIAKGLGDSPGTVGAPNRGHGRPFFAGLAARAPYFHNGSAANLNDVVTFYDKRFNVGFTDQEKVDLIAFLSSL